MKTKKKITKKLISFVNFVKLHNSNLKIKTAKDIMGLNK